MGIIEKLFTQITEVYRLSLTDPQIMSATELIADNQQNNTLVCWQQHIPICIFQLQQQIHQHHLAINTQYISVCEGEQNNKQTSQMYVGSIRSSTSSAFSPTNGPKRLPFFMAFLHHSPNTAMFYLLRLRRQREASL